MKVWLRNLLCSLRHHTAPSTEAICPCRKTINNVVVAKAEAEIIAHYSRFDESERKRLYNLYLAYEIAHTGLSTLAEAEILAHYSGFDESESKRLYHRHRLERQLVLEYIGDS